MVRIFAPEHGYLGNYSAGKTVVDGIDLISGAEVVSLYGKNKAPQDSDLKDIDVLIFDIQDIGVRYYTYISTMTLAMQKAAKNSVKFIILDRPNPLNGIEIEGPISIISSFVGMHPIPVRHGMTIGEMALFIKQNNLINNADELDLEIIKMEGWDRQKMYSSRFGRWIPPSPNIPNLKTALIYIGTCLLEGTNVSEGRGTNRPFMLFGAPWLDNKKIVKNLNRYNFEDVRFSVYNFTPRGIPGKSENPKYKDVFCNGIKIKIYNKNKINSFDIGIAIIEEIYKAHPDDFEFKDDFFDKLYGSSDLRLAILAAKDITKNEKDKDIIGEFKKLREKALLYR